MGFDRDIVLSKEQGDIHLAFLEADIKLRSLDATVRADGLRDCLKAYKMTENLTVRNGSISAYIRLLPDALQIMMCGDPDPTVSRMAAFMCFTPSENKNTGENATAEEERQVLKEVSDYVSKYEIEFFYDVWMSAVNKTEKGFVIDAEMAVYDRFPFTLAGQPIMTMVPEWAKKIHEFRSNAQVINLDEYTDDSKDPWAAWKVREHNQRSYKEKGVIVARSVTIEATAPAQPNTKIFIDPALKGLDISKTLNRYGIPLQEAFTLKAEGWMYPHPQHTARYIPAAVQPAAFR